MGLFRYYNLGIRELRQFLKTKKRIHKKIDNSFEGYIYKTNKSWRILEEDEDIKFCCRVIDIESEKITKKNIKSTKYLLCYEKINNPNLELLGKFNVQSEIVIDIKPKRKTKR